MILQYQSISLTTIRVTREEGVKRCVTSYMDDSRNELKMTSSSKIVSYLRKTVCSQGNNRRDEDMRGHNSMAIHLKDFN
jgi:hypothetical protein